MSKRCANAKPADNEPQDYQRAEAGERHGGGSHGIGTNPRQALPAAMSHPEYLGQRRQTCFEATN